MGIRRAWSKLSTELDQVQQVWLLLSIANAAVRLEEFEEAMDALSALLEYYAESKIIVGNPLFQSSGRFNLSRTQRGC